MHCYFCYLLIQTPPPPFKVISITTIFLLLFLVESRIWRWSEVALWNRGVIRLLLRRVCFGIKMSRVSVGTIIKTRITYKISGTLISELPGCSNNIYYFIFINRMNIFPSGNRFTVTIINISGYISTGIVTASSIATIASTTAMTNPVIYSTSNMASIIGVLESRTVTSKMITTKFIEFLVTRMRRVANIIRYLHM